MAQSTKSSESPSPFEDDMYGASPPPHSRATRRSSDVDISPSPSVSISSDKENRSARPADKGKGKGRAPMGPPSIPVVETTKRRRPAERHESISRNQRRKTVEVDEDIEERLAYDPDQNIEERREIRKGLRDLSKNLNENRAELLNPKSSLLKDTLRDADAYADRVQQTSDATIDSRLLVSAADLSYKKTVALISGDTSQGIDVDELISKCMSFMRAAEGAEEEDGTRVAAPKPSSTQRRRTQQARADEDDEEDEDGDMLNWEHLGRFACLPYNSRPSVPGFLLGPLSLEKRARKAVVRKAPLRAKNLQETRPEVLEAQDIHRDENANLTTLCRAILLRLQKVIGDAQKAAEQEYDESMTDEQAQVMMDRHGVSRSGGLCLFRFAINPRSFGQTIENIFYVSFLIRDGKVGVTSDERGMPYLHPANPRTKEEIRDQGAHKHQSVIALDMTEWEELIQLFDIRESMIKHRVEEQQAAPGAKGWYA